MHPTSRTIHTQTALTLTAALLTAGSLAACASGSASEAADASSTTPTISATATPSTAPTPTLSPELANLREKALNMPEPDKPEQLTENTSEGAATFGAYVVDLYRYAVVTGDTTAFEAISPEQCEFCKATLELARSLPEEGEWAEAWSQDITDIEIWPPDEDHPFVQVHVTADLGAMTTRDRSGNVTDRSPADPGAVLALAIYFDGDQWMLRDAEAVAE